MIKGGFRPKGEFLWPLNRPVTGARIEFCYGKAWYPGTYDDGKDWPAPVWVTADGAVLEGAEGVACSVACSVAAVGSVVEMKSLLPAFTQDIRGPIHPSHRCARGQRARSAAGHPGARRCIRG